MILNILYYTELDKNYTTEKTLFENWEDCKGGPGSVERVLIGFGTLQQKKLTLLHKKVMLHSSILKKYHQSKGDFIYGQYDIFIIIVYTFRNV